MAVNTNLQNWALWDFDQRSNYIIETGNPTVGFGGGTVFQEITEQNSQTSVRSMTEDGQMNIFNDDCITIVGGVTKDGGTCINLVGKNGDVTITAEKNGDIKIKGSNILIDADENINITSRKNVTIKGSNSIYFDTPNLNTNALTGQLAPRDVTFGGLVFRGTKVGTDVVSNAFTGGSLDTLQSVAKESAAKASKQLTALSGNLDTGALASQAAQAQSSLTDALNNFGGFG